MTASVLGIIGGSGFYHLPGLEHAHWERVLALGRALRRHPLRRAGRLSRALPAAARARPPVPPSAINFRANIDALKRAGVTTSSRSRRAARQEAYAPGHFVLVDQFIDRTSAREKSFFGPGCAAHVSLADPVSPLLVEASVAACTAETRPYARRHLSRDGGPQFSTRAESNLYRSWGCDVIG